MAKLTLLELVRDILSDADGDEVNSIDDTVESTQAANIVRSTYHAMMSNRNWAHTKTLVKLVPFSSSANPTHIRISENIKELISLYYDKRKQGDTNKQYRKMIWKEPDDFLRMVHGRNNTNANVKTVIDPSGIELFILNDKAPEYYTSFNDETIVFDSWDLQVDSTINSSKMQATAYVAPGWSNLDDFIPDLPEEAFAALQEEAKSKFSLRHRQIADEKAEQESRRQQTWLSRKNWSVNGGVKYPNYGRRGK